MNVAGREPSSTDKKHLDAQQEHSHSHQSHDKQNISQNVVHIYVNPFLGVQIYKSKKDFGPNLNFIL